MIDDHDGNGFEIFSEMSGRASAGRIQADEEIVDGLSDADGVLPAFELR